MLSLITLNEFQGMTVSPTRNLYMQHYVVNQMGNRIICCTVQCPPRYNHPSNSKAKLDEISNVHASETESAGLNCKDPIL